MGLKRRRRTSMGLQLLLVQPRLELQGLRIPILFRCSGSNAGEAAWDSEAGSLPDRGGTPRQTASLTGSDRRRSEGVVSL